ncbi:MAG: hypothetical protein ACOX8E_11410 [Ruminococcus sp.]|jgi:hypothetical protein
MFFRKNRMKEVFLTSDAELFGLMITALKQNHIPCETKTVNMGMQNRGTGVILGQIGENINVEIMYYIYVNEKDVQMAQHVIQKYQRQTAE